MDSAELSSSLRTVVSGLHKSLRKQMSPVSTYSMTEIETIALLTRHAALLPTELAALTRVKTQSMSQIINKLTEQGVVKRTPSRDDKRKVYISLTAAGKKMVEKTRYERDAWLKGVIEKALTDKERDLLVKALAVMNKLIETK
ncbi:MAG: MarR family winged helix-turn-helix transcriptional regulator [Bacteroidia bacterium]